MASQKKKKKENKGNKQQQLCTDSAQYSAAQSQKIEIEAGAHLFKLAMRMTMMISLVLSCLVETEVGTNWIQGEEEEGKEGQKDRWW